MTGKQYRTPRYLVAMGGDVREARTRRQAMRTYRAMLTDANGDRLAIWSRDGRKQSWLFDPGAMVEAEAA